MAKKHWKNIYQDAVVKKACEGSKQKFQRGCAKAVRGSLKDIDDSDIVDKSRGKDLGMIYYEKETNKFSLAAHGVAKNPVTAREVKNKEVKAGKEGEVRFFL